MAGPTPIPAQAHPPAASCFHCGLPVPEGANYPITYRQRTGLDTDVFRLGQSFWPEPALAACPPRDLVGRWSVNSLVEPAWRERGSGLPLEESFYYASYRSTADASGEFALLTGLNETFGRRADVIKNATE